MTTFGIIGQFQQLTNHSVTNAYTGEEIFIEDDEYKVNTGIYTGDAGPDQIQGITSNDFLTIRNAADQQTVIDIDEYNLGGGNDVLILADATFTTGDLEIYAGQGNDLIWSNAGNDTIWGNDGDDIIHGGPGNDFIAGDNHNTFFLYLNGDDDLNGGAGSDTFFYTAGNDVITDDDSTEYNVLHIASGLASVIEDLDFSFDSEDLLVTILSTSETIRIEGQLDNHLEIDEIILDDGLGVVIDLANILAPVGADFELALGSNGDLRAVNLSESVISLEEINLDFTQLGSDTFFDTTDDSPGNVSEGFSVTENQGSIVATLPDDLLTDGEQTATIGFEGFDPGDSVAIDFDLDALSNLDMDGDPLGGQITALFSNGQSVTKTIGDLAYTINGTTLDLSTATLPPGLTGDFNDDGEVDAADYTLWRDEFGATGEGLSADANGDGYINQVDYDLWASNYGATAISLSQTESNTVSIPEPTSAFLSGLMLLFVWCKREFIPRF